MGKCAFMLILCLASAALGVISEPNGATDVSVYVYALDPNGDPNTSPVVTNLDLYYVEQGAVMATKVDATALTAADSAHSDNKAYHVGQGCVRVDWPDVAFDGGYGHTVELIVVDGAGDDRYVPVTVQLGVDVASARGSTPMAQAQIETYAQTGAQGAINASFDFDAAGYIYSHLADANATADANAVSFAAALAAFAWKTTLYGEDANGLTEEDAVTANVTQIEGVDATDQLDAHGGTASVSEDDLSHWFTSIISPDPNSGSPMYYLKHPPLWK